MCVTSVLPKQNRLRETQKQAQPTGCPLSHWCPKKLRSGYGVLQLIFKLREVSSHENWYIYIMRNHVIGGCALNHGLEKVCAQKCGTSIVGVPTFHGQNNKYQQWTIVYNSIRQWIGMRKNRDRGKSKDSQV